MQRIIPGYQQVRGAISVLHLAAGFAGLAGVLGVPEAASAIQVHPAPEGLYVHQIAHVFFAVSLTLLAFWLQRRGLVSIPGWRSIQVACLLLVAWNLVALCGHYVEGRLTEPALIHSKQGAMLAVESPWAALYYVLKMDHFFCVPGMACLFRGLNRLSRSAGGSAP